MNKIKNGDIVGRISYNKDIIFIVKDVNFIYVPNVYHIQGERNVVKIINISRNL